MESPAFRFKCQFLFNRTPQNETFGSCHFDLRVKTKIWNNLVWESPATNKEILKKMRIMRKQRGKKRFSSCGMRIAAPSFPSSYFYNSIPLLQSSLFQPCSVFLLRVNQKKKRISGEKNGGSAICLDSAYLYDMERRMNAIV